MPNKLNILAVDAATRTGWATLINGRIESGVQDFSLKRGESPGMRFLRFNAWIRMIDDINLDTNRLSDADSVFDLVVYELAHHRGGYTTELAVGLATRIQEFAAGRSIDYTGVHTAILKKSTAGKGNASKEDMMAWFKSEIGRDPIDDNEADAMALLHWAIREYRVEAPVNG